jgi:hypothetical protein
VSLYCVPKFFGSILRFVSHSNSSKSNKDNDEEEEDIPGRGKEYASTNEDDCEEAKESRDSESE